MPIDHDDRSTLIPMDADPRVRACMEVPKHVSADTSMRLHKDNNEDAPQWVGKLNFY